MGDERLFAVDHQPHAAFGLAREQRGDQLDVQRLGAAAEAAADMRLHHADLRHVHGEDLRQHQVHVVGHLGGGVHRHTVALGVVARDRGVHLHLVLADLGAIVGRLAHQVGAGERLLDIAKLEEDIAFEIAGLLGVQQYRAGRRRLGSGEIGRQLLHLHLDERERRLGGGVVDGGDSRDRLAAIAYLVARQRMLGARDRQHAEGLVALGAGNDRLDARKLQRFRYVDVDDHGMRIGAAVNAPGERARLDREVGGVFGAAGNFLRAVHHRHIVADIVRGHHFVHVVRPLHSPPPCGEGQGVGVPIVGRVTSNNSAPPPQPSPNKRAFTPVFDGLWGEGAHRASGESTDTTSFMARRLAGRAMPRISPPR